MLNCFRDQQDFLYIVIPYFNYCGFKRRHELFIQFVNRTCKTKGVRIVISECTSGPLKLPVLDVFLHLKFDIQSPIWIKENLVNVAVGHLPSNWKYVAWIDADIVFLNRRWVQDTIRTLETTCDVVQMFQTAVNLGPRNEALKIDKSFGYMYKDSGTPLVKTDKYGFWHPGYAWACTRHAWNAMNGLLDWAILGSGDRHMAYALIGRVLDSAPGNIHENYKIMLMEFQKKCTRFKLGYIPGTILHYWHGSLKNRRYRERWEILTDFKFDPRKDLTRDPSGVLQFTHSGQRMEIECMNYFMCRKEDDQQIQ